MDVNVNGMYFCKQELYTLIKEVGNTTVKSIFFISDVIPVKKEYIDREYLGFDGKLYIIKNNVVTAPTTYA